MSLKNVPFQRMESLLYDAITSGYFQIVSIISKQALQFSLYIDALVNIITLCSIFSVVSFFDT